MYAFCRGAYVVSIGKITYSPAENHVEQVLRIA